jgi:hypothetical protein
MEVLIDDREAITAVLVARADLPTQRDLVRKLVDAHRELTGGFSESR